MLKPLIYISRKKMKTARACYDTYCKCNNLKDTAASTGLAINTIRKYIALIEDINNTNKLSTKDRYYNSPEPPPGDKPLYNNNIYNKDIYNIKDNIYKDNNNNDNEEDISYIENENNDIEVITNNNISLKDTKNKILLGKLDSIGSKYLDYLDNATDEQIAKTSLKDHAVIAGILLDKKILLEHKQADVIKNQSIIFNLFGNNTNLSKFITDSLDRQHKLAAKPVKKYELAVNK